MKEFTCLAIRYQKQTLQVLDQRLLPQQEVWITVENPIEMVHIIKQLSVRGAPLIGVSAALALAHFGLKNPKRHEIEKYAHQLSQARPTAVNLQHAMQRMLKADDLTLEAEAILEEEIQSSEAMATFGNTLIGAEEAILTHCNTGSLATPGIGTALGVIIKAHQMGKNIHVYVDETRPLLQGGRLTTWELERYRIPYTLISDTMSAKLMQEGKVNRVLVGADRIALNGDFANKIGTYSLAVLAHYHAIPFHGVAPVSTIDPECKNGSDIPIELRDADEVRTFRGKKISPEQAVVYNPSFDVTPVELVTSHILDCGIISRNEIKSGGLLCGL